GCGAVAAGDGSVQVRHRPAPVAAARRVLGIVAGVFGPRIDQPDRARVETAAREDRAARDDPGDGGHPADVAAGDRAGDRAAEGKRGQPGSLHVRAGRRVQPALAATGDRGVGGSAAAGRCEHRADRLLSRVPGAGPPRLPAPLAVGAQPQVQHAPPRHRRVGAGARGGGRRVARPAGDPGPHLHVRPAGRVHADQRRPRQGEVARAWGINLVHRRFATALGVAATALGCAYAIAVKKGWLGAARSGFVAAEDAERAATEMGSAVEILTVAEAIQMREMYRSSTLVALRSANLRVFQEALARVRGCGESAVYLIFVDEIPGLFFPPNTGPSREAREVLAIAVEYFKEAGMVAIPIWRMAHDAGASLAGAARKLEVGAVL